MPSPLVFSHHSDVAQAQQLAERLGLRCVSDWQADPEQQYLHYVDQRLSLGLSPAARQHPVCVDFAEQWRTRHRGKELLLKAIGGRREGLTVIDATAGLGRDSLLLASYGAQVVLCERQPVVAALLADGLRRGRLDADSAPLVSRMSLAEGSAVDYLNAAGEQPLADVVYLDPMFPESGKSARVKKEMQLFHQLVGPDADADVLLAAALTAARHRVVVKRPPKAPVIDGPRAPQFSIKGKAVRFDVYPLKAFAKA